MRFRDDTPAFQARAQAAVARWREQHPQGTPDEMAAAVGPSFPGHGPALRAALIAADRHRAREVTGIGPGTAGAGR